MTLWDFIHHFIATYGGIILTLALICCVLIFISYLLIRWIMLPWIKKFLSDFDLFKSKVDDLGESMVRVETEMNATSDKVDLINQMNHDSITEMKVIILDMKESIHDMSKIVNRILKEHYKNHPEK